MRGLCLAFLLFVAAFLGSACSDPARVARREVDRIARVTLVADARAKRITEEALTRVAVEEGTARGLALRAAGCPSGSALQPASAPAQCARIAGEYLARYRERCEKIRKAAGKVDQAVIATWASLRVVVDVLEDLEAGFGDATTLTAKLQKVVIEAARVGVDLYRAFEEFKALFTGGAK